MMLVVFPVASIVCGIWPYSESLVLTRLSLLQESVCIFVLRVTSTALPDGDCKHDCSMRMITVE